VNVWGLSYYSSDAGCMIVKLHDPSRVSLIFQESFAMRHTS
jgi:hypothetical protein